MKTRCIHHNDPDGRVFGAVIRRALGREILLYEMGYNGHQGAAGINFASRAIPFPPSAKVEFLG